MTSSNAIGKLIEGCLDDERMLEHESHTVGSHRRAVLHNLATKRARFAERLRQIAGQSDVGSRNGSWRELGRELGRSLRWALGGPSDSDAISACRRSCRRLESRFDKVLALRLPPAVRTVVAEQRIELDEDMNALVALQY